MFKWILAIRYLLKRPVTILAVLAVTLSVFISLVVMTVMHGLVQDYRDKTHAWVGDAVVSTPSLVGFSFYTEFLQQLEGLDEVEAAAPVVQTVGLMRQPGQRRINGVKVVGLDAEQYNRVSAWNSFLHYRRDQLARAFVPTKEPNAAGFIAGIDMILNKNSDGIYSYPGYIPDIKLEVICFPLTAKGAPARAGMGEVNSRVFTFSDLCHTGLAREDYGVIYVSLAQAQWLCGMDGPYPRVSAIHLRFRPGVSPSQGLAHVQAVWNEFRQAFRSQPTGSLLDQVRVQSWQRYQRNQIAAMEKEEVMVALMFLLVGVTTGFVVFVVFYMIVSHKSKDVGILKSVGVSDAAVMGLFTRFALLVGTSGLGLGLLSGWVFVHWMNPLEDWLYQRFGWQIWNRAMYSIGDIPSDIRAPVVGSIAVVTLVVCLLGALVPAWKAARLRPVESLQVTQV